MKKQKLLVLSLIFLFLFSNLAPAQINVGRIKGKVKSGLNKNKTSNNSNSGTNTNTNTNTNTETSINTNVKKVAKIEKARDVGTYFHNSFKAKEYLNSVNIGDELYVNFNLNKTMYDFGKENGFDSGFQYGFITIYINGVKVDMAGPYSFQSNQTKVWTDFSVPLAVSPDFIKKIQDDQSMLATSQDIWAFQQLFQENSIIKKYTTAAITTMKQGDNKLKIEFGLGSSNAKEPSVVICTGEVTVVSDEAGLKELYKKGPKNLVPLDDSEKANFTFSANSFALGSGVLTTKLVMPNPPKYYNMKWCKATSCDYDHGNLNIAAFLDGEYLAFWRANFTEKDYATTTSYDLILFPQNDHGLSNPDADINSSILVDGANSVVHSLFDKAYSGNLKEGKHTLRLKMYSSECVPYSVTFENTKAYHNRWPSIAENTVEFQVNAAGIAKLVSTSSAKKLSHAGGTWTAVDAYLKANIANGMPEITIIDVATFTKWKVTVNALGVPLYRDCKADIIYNSSQYGCRILKAVSVRESFEGNNKYGNPFVNEVLNSYFYGDATVLNSMHYAIPLSKVK